MKPQDTPPRAPARQGDAPQNRRRRRSPAGWARLTGLLSLVAAAVLTACSSTPPPARPVARDDFKAVAQQVQALIDQQMKAHRVTGMSIAIVDDQGVLWSYGAGHADVQAARPASEHTVYRMGSVSKLLTATAAVQLADAGRLALDQPIEQALPGFAVRSAFGPAPITPRLLMSHHAGLPRDLARGMWGAQVGRHTDAVARLPDTDLAYPPGTLFAYSNLGFTLLGTLVERAAGQPFEAHMRQALLEPLGMHTASFSSHPPHLPQMAQAYAGGHRAEEPGLRDLPAGGLNASVLDMGRFMTMVLAGGQIGGRRVLSSARVAEMLSPQAPTALDFTLHAGLGWMLNTIADDGIRGAGPVAHHSGATIHHRSQLYLLPAQRLGVVVVSNSATAGEAVDLVARRALALALEARSGIRQGPAPVAPFQPAAQPWPEADLQAWAGHWATVQGHVLISRAGSGLHAELAGQRLELQPGDAHRARLSLKLLGLIPVKLGALERLVLERRTVDGRELMLAHLGEQTMLAGQRLPQRVAPELAAEARLLQGEYEPAPGTDAAEELEKVVVVPPPGPGAPDGLLLVHVVPRTDGPRPPPATLWLTEPGVARLVGPLADAGEVVRWQHTNGQIHAHFAGYELIRRGTASAP